MSGRRAADLPTFVGLVGELAPRGGPGQRPSEARWAVEHAGRAWAGVLARDGSALPGREAHRCAVTTTRTRQLAGCGARRLAGDGLMEVLAFAEVVLAVRMVGREASLLPLRANAPEDPWGSLREVLEGASDPWCEPSSGPPPPPVETEGGEAACRRLLAAALWCSPSADRGDAFWVRWPGGPDGKPHVEHVQAGGSPTRTRRGTPAEAMGKAIAAATRPRAWGWARRIEGYPVNRASGWRRERVPYVVVRPGGSAVLAALAVGATNHGEEAAHLRAWLGAHAPELVSLVEG